MHIKEHVLLKPYTTFKMGGEAFYFAQLSSLSEVEEFARFAQDKNLPLVILGGGSNVILPEETLKACVGLIQIQGFEIISDNTQHVVVKIGAGEVWDEIVLRSVELGLSGIEALSAIPGSAGATPVQNVGAYGQEIADALVSLEAYDTKIQKKVALSAKDCKFSYRDSIFKQEAKNRYVIVSITIKLSHAAPQIPDYAGVKKYFEDKKIEQPSLSQIRSAIIEIRSKKLPDPSLIASCGSFFKNPIISSEAAAILKRDYKEAVLYPLQSGEYKVAAGWLIDSLGLRGRKFGRVAVYEHNALVLVNTDNATREELIEAVRYIQKEVQGAFGVALELEPEWIS